MSSDTARALDVVPQPDSRSLGHRLRRWRHAIAAGLGRDSQSSAAEAPEAKFEEVRAIDPKQLHEGDKLRVVTAYSTYEFTVTHSFRSMLKLKCTNIVTETDRAERPKSSMLNAELICTTDRPISKGERLLGFYTDPDDPRGEMHTFTSTPMTRIEVQESPAGKGD